MKLNLEYTDDIYVKSKPIFNKKQIFFMRDEKKDFTSIILKKYAFLNDLLIDPLAHKILNLCDGTKSIEDICSEISQLYINIDKDIIYKDLIDLLNQYNKISLITWKDGVNPFMDNYILQLGNGFKIELASETCLEELVNFFKYRDKNKVFYINPGRIINEYIDELVIREKLFMRAEEFIVVKNNENKIEGVISVLIPSRMRSTTSSIGIILMPEEFIGESLRFLTQSLQNISVKTLKKIKYQHIINNNMHQLRSEFLNNKFITEAILKKEHEDNDIEILSYIFE